MRQPFPEQIREIYLQHNGHVPSSEAPAILGPGFCFHRLEEMVGDWSTNESLRLAGEDFAAPDNPPQVRPLIWHSRMIPIASDGGGASVVVDCSPSHLGTMGQILIVDFESPVVDLVGDSLSDYVTALLRDLRSPGGICVSRMAGIVGSSDGWPDCVPTLG